LQLIAISRSFFKVSISACQFEFSSRTEGSNGHFLSDEGCDASKYPAFQCCQGRAGSSQMPDKTYIVMFKESTIGPQLVRAERIEIHGEHLAFIRSDGELSGLFLFEIVKDWSEVDP
jgi:hypothetical protein